MRQARITLLPIILVVPLLIAAGCGGGDDGEGNADTTAAATTATEESGDEHATEESGDEHATGESDEHTTEIVMSDFKFEPLDVSAGSDSTIEVLNEGAVDHDLLVRKDGKTLGGIDVIAGGQSAKLKVDVEPGEYEIYCSVPGHEEAGMVGTLTVMEMAN